jgi:hypothetical protein
MTPYLTYFLRYDFVTLMQRYLRFVWHVAVVASMTPTDLGSNKVTTCDTLTTKTPLI